MLPFKKFLDKSELNLLPLYKHEVRIELIEDHQHALRSLEAISGTPVLGFDIEIRPVFVKGQSNFPTLLQLAVEDCTYLFRLNKIGLLPEIKDILSNQSILKVGVAVRDDVKALIRLSEFDPKGFFDIAKEAKEQGFENQGLRGLVGIFLGMRLSKGAKVTNWERDKLSEAQIHYAASDARASLMIYQLMQEHFQIGMKEVT